MRPATLTNTTSKRLSGRKAEKKTKWVAKGRPWRKKFPKISLEGADSNPFYQLLHATYTSLSFLHSSNSFVCLRRRVQDTSRIGSTRATLAMLRALVEARDIRGSQFIFPADSSKNFLRSVCRRSSGRQSSDASMP